MNETNLYQGMFDVSKKGDTLGIATAQAIIKVSPDSIDLIKNKKTPKGNIIETAKISAALGAKKQGINTVLPFYSNRSHFYRNIVI